MNVDVFNKIVERRFEECKKTLVIKAKEYVRGDDRLSNFKDEAAMLRCSYAFACLSKLSKHVTSVVDLVKDEDNGLSHSKSLWDEKIGDCVNYLILLEAIAEERRQSCKTP